MVDIDLFNKDEQETKNDYEVTVNKSDFADHFHKVKYDIKFKKPFEYSIRTWLTGPKPYNINIKFRNRNPFSYHVVVEHQIVREVETYFSNHNPNVPLIIGFKPDNSEFEYYTFLSLTGKGWSYGLPSDIGFGTNDLVQRLKQENEKRNKIKYITERGNSQKYYITDSLVQGVRKYTFTAKDDESSQDHQIETNHLLSKGLLDRTIIEKMLYEMKDKTFNSINVYSSIRSNVAILFEFVSETIKVRFERKDNDGYYWMKNISTYDYRYDQGTDVKKIESEYEKRITYQLDKNSNINSGYKKIIEVTEVLKTNSFTAYTHRPKNLESIALTYVLYNDKAITIVANENITSSQGKLEQKNIQISNFKEISTYVLNDRANEHLLIKITKDRVNYYFSRFSKAGTKWRQVCLEELRDSGIDTSSVNQLHVFDKKLESLLNGDSGHGNVEKLLIFIRFEINSIVVLLNKKIMYCKPDIQEVVGTNSKEKHVPPIDIDTNTIEVSDETDTKGNCVKEKRYYLYQHNITEAASKGLGKPGDVTLFLRFYLDKNLIHLYENLNKIEIPTYLTYSPGINDLYVYFYGDRSIRPLLLCYNGKSFKSNDKDSYYTKWILDNDVKDCVCKQDSSKLIKALNKTKFSNVIYLYEQIGSGFEYPGSKLFTWYNHQQEGSKKGDIDLYKGRQGNKLVLKPGGVYKDLTLKYAEVYFNRYDESNTPLIVALSFSSVNQKPYYLLSSFENDLTRQFKMVNTLGVYQSDGTLLRHLVEENDKLNDLLVYNIETKQGEKSTDIYNAAKINIKLHQKGPPDLSSSRFMRYKHTPQHQHGTKKSCVIFKNNVLLCWRHSKAETIDQIQGQLLISVDVYFSNNRVEEPFLAAFEIGGSNSKEWQYYYRKWYPRGFYWQRIGIEESNSLLGLKIEYNNIHNEFIQNEERWIELLNKLEFIFLNTVVLLIEKQESYTKGDVDSCIKKTEPKLFHDPTVTDAQPQTINVRKESCSKLQEKGYNCYSQTIVASGSPDTAELRLLVPSGGKSDKFGELKLYNNKGTNIEANREYFISKRSSTPCKIRVYFYGSDPRPLLLCLNDKAYRATNKKNYDEHKWEQVDIGTFSCDSGDNTKLIGALSEVVGFLNEVNIYEIDNLYQVHKYKGEPIQIKVMSSSLKCYKKYLHTPNTGYRLGKIEYNSQGKKGSLRYSSEQTLLLVGVYYYKEDTTLTEPLVIELEFKNGTHSGSYKKYHKLKIGTSIQWSEELNTTEITDNISAYLDKLRYELKKIVQIVLEHNKNGSYLLKGTSSTNEREQFKPLNGGTNIIVTEESCEKLKEANYKCIKHELTNVNSASKNQMGGLKIFMTKKLPKENSGKSNSDQKISLYNIIKGRESEVQQKLKEEKDKDKEKEAKKETSNLYKGIESCLKIYEPIHYTSCMGDFYVYFYVAGDDKKQNNTTDPRPGLICFSNMAYRPIKIPELGVDNNYSYGSDEHNKWISVSEITRCGCEEEDKLIKVLNDVYNIAKLNIALIAGSSAGGLTGAVGIGAIGFFVFKKVVSVSATAATVATVAL